MTDCRVAWQNCWTKCYMDSMVRQPKNPRWLQPNSWQWQRWKDHTDRRITGKLWWPGMVWQQLRVWLPKRLSLTRLTHWRRSCRCPSSLRFPSKCTWSLIFWFFDFFPFFSLSFFASVFGMCCAANCLLQSLFGWGLNSCNVLHTVCCWRLASFRIGRKSDSSLFTGLQSSGIYLAQICMSRLIHSGSEGNFSVGSEHPLFYLELR